jgi:hypothetical protein
MIIEGSTRDIQADTRAFDDPLSDDPDLVRVLFFGTGSFDDSVSSSAEAGVASANASARQTSDIQSWLLTANGSLNEVQVGGAADASSNAASLAKSFYQFTFSLTAPQPYTLSGSLSGSLTPPQGLGSFLGNILLERTWDGFDGLSLSLPTDSGPFLQTGTLDATTYQLTVEFVLDAAAPWEASTGYSGSANYDVTLVVAEPAHVGLAAGLAVLGWAATRRGRARRAL